MRFTDEKGTSKKNRVHFLDLGWSAVGASVAIALALWFVGRHEGPFLLASLGGSTVFLFALRDTEAAQPRALFGGHFGGALIGILCFQMFGDALWVSAAAVALTMVLMVATRTIHPPAGANPLLMVHNHASFYTLLNPVGIGVLTLFIAAMLWSRLGRGKVYPVKWL
ncbi:MAG: HPP family protein [Deltaproteobacteria bacterium]|nr:HPP family protein [Deltaproteobacteria bacterium]